MRVLAPGRREARRQHVLRVAVAGSTLAGFLAGTGPAGADTVSVACGGPGGGAAGLVDAISQANGRAGPDTIDLTAGCTYVLTSAVSADNGLPVVTGQLTVRGHGATVKRGAAAAFRILEVAPGAEVALDQIAVVGGLVSLSGPTAFGGGILNGGTLTVTRSEIRDNEVKGTGSSAGGGGIANNGTATLDDTVLRGNRASATGTAIFAAVGGAVLNRDAGTMTITGGAVLDGTAVSRGSSPFIFIASAGGVGNSGAITVSDTRIAGNRAAAVGLRGQAGGGGMSVANGTVTLTGSAVHGNTAFATGEGAAAHGGGLENSGQTKLVATPVRDNRVSGPVAQGGGIFNVRNRLVILDGKVTGNVANAESGPGQGGGIYAEAGLVVLRRTDVFANQPDDCVPSIPGC